MTAPRLHRRTFLAGLATAGALAVSPVRAQSSLDGTALGITGQAGIDQTDLLQAAMEQAATEGRMLLLPPGRIDIGDLVFPPSLMLQGVPGRTIFSVAGGAVGTSWLVLRDLGFEAAPGKTDEAPLLALSSGDGVVLERCQFHNAPAIALSLTDTEATVRDCGFTGNGDAAIHAQDSRGVLLAGNRISGAGNAGIRIWRNAPGADGAIVTNNRIEQIEWRGGGNGQNGNGINVFNADEVIVANNHIADCAFTAVRLNTTHNCQVSGNICLRSGEVAIFSEFGFSGSVIADNVVDGAAAGISITNLDSGGHLATCSGNIVRNIAERSAVNPDTTPVGIFAEADTAITGNTVSAVPGVAIAAGYGAFLRNVAITGNVVHHSRIGIGVSVVDGAGAVHIGNNVLDTTEHRIIGLAWDDIIEPDLATNAERYPNVTIN